MAIYRKSAIASMIVFFICACSCNAALTNQNSSQADQSSFSASSMKSEHSSASKAAEEISQIHRLSEYEIVELQISDFTQYPHLPTENDSSKILVTACHTSKYSAYLFLEQIWDTYDPYEAPDASRYWLEVFDGFGHSNTVYDITIPQWTGSSAEWGLSVCWIDETRLLLNGAAIYNAKTEELTWLQYPDETFFAQKKGNLSPELAGVDELFLMYAYFLQNIAMGPDGQLVYTLQSNTPYDQIYLYDLNKQEWTTLFAGTMYLEEESNVDRYTYHVNVWWEGVDLFFAASQSDREQGNAEIETFQFEPESQSVRSVQSVQIDYAALACVGDLQNGNLVFFEKDKHISLYQMRTNQWTNIINYEFDPHSRYSSYKDMMVVYDSANREILFIDFAEMVIYRFQSDVLMGVDPVNNSIKIENLDYAFPAF